MSNYFQGVGCRSTFKSTGPFVKEEFDPELLLDYFKEQDKKLDLKSIDLIYKEWCGLLFSRYNVVVQGRQSKFRLLESFKARYLDSGRIPDHDTDGSYLSITTIRLHGFTPIPLEKFHHALFNVKENRKDVTDEVKAFLKAVRTKKIHHVFLMHSFELLYRDCQPICDLIFNLYKQENEYIHILLSADHINSGKILNRLKFQMNLIFFNVPHGDSFLHEKSEAVCIMDDIGVKENQQTMTLVFDLNIQSLKDVYQAMQSACQKIMVYIIKNFIQQNRLQQLAQNQKDDDSKPKIDRESRRKTRQRQLDSTDLDFNQLLSHCQAEFITHRANTLKDHLGELVDHGIIKIDPTGNKIQCLVDLDSCVKFVKYTS